MNIIFFLIGCSIFIALIFLSAFFWAARTGQHDDTYTPSVRILFEDEVSTEPKESKKSDVEVEQTLDLGAKIKCFILIKHLFFFLFVRDYPLLLFLDCVSDFSELCSTNPQFVMQYMQGFFSKFLIFIFSFFIMYNLSFFLVDFKYNKKCSKIQICTVCFFE